MSRELIVSAVEQTGIGGLHQEWITGEDEQGNSFELTAGAGLANPYLYMRVTLPDGRTARECVDIRTLCTEWATAMINENGGRHDGDDVVHE